MVSNERNSTVFKIFALVLIFFLFIFSVYFLLISIHSYFPSDSGTYTKSDLGTLGDLVGGLSNPFFTFLTICLLIWSIRIQGKELKEATEQSRRAANSLEQTTELHNSNLEEQKRSLLIPQIMTRLDRETSILQSLYWGSNNMILNGSRESDISIPPLSEVLNRTIDNEEELAKLVPQISTPEHKKIVLKGLEDKFAACTSSILEISNICKSLKLYGAPDVLYKDELNQAAILNDRLNSTSKKVQMIVDFQPVFVVTKIDGFDHIERPSIILVNNATKRQGKPYVFINDVH